jgi:hypothetical protein
LKTPSTQAEEASETETARVADAAAAVRLSRIVDRLRGWSAALEQGGQLHAQKRVSIDDMSDTMRLRRGVADLQDAQDLHPRVADALKDVFAGMTAWKVDTGTGPMRSRVLDAFRRARGEGADQAAWSFEKLDGESLLGTMTRVISEGASTPAMAVSRFPTIEELRTEFDALPPSERADEIERHLWAVADPSRVRTRFSPLLNAIGIR